MSVRSPQPAGVVGVARVGGLCIHDAVLPQQMAEGFFDADRMKGRQKFLESLI